jgi:hypothetical protein
MRQMHHFCLLDEMLVPREPENGLPLFTELPRRKMFSETHIRGGETLCVWTGGKPIFSLCLGPMEHAA